MISFVAGDLLQASEQYIAQGVAEGNQEGLGTGLALKISSKWPAAQVAFKRYCRSGRFRGGTIWVFPPDQSIPGIIYMATQPDMYHATLPYLRKSLRALAAWAELNGVKSVALPKIGAGLGKLSWDKQVKPLMIEQLDTVNCAFVVYEQFNNSMGLGSR